jgi:hypothetical protein
LRLTVERFPRSWSRGQVKYGYCNCSIIRVRSGSVNMRNN